MRSVYILILLLAPITLFAEDVAVQAPSSLQEIIVMVIGAIFTALVIPWINSLRKKAAAEEKTENLTRKEMLIKTAKTFAIDTALTIVERDFPILISRAQKEKLTTDVVKQILHGFGTELKGDVIKFFKTQGIDIVAELGEEFIDFVVRYAADKVSPFPGSETAEALISSGAKAALSVGIEKAKRVIQ